MAAPSYPSSPLLPQPFTIEHPPASRFSLARYFGSGRLPPPPPPHTRSPGPVPFCLLQPPPPAFLRLSVASRASHTQLSSSQSVARSSLAVALRTCASLFFSPLFLSNLRPHLVLIVDLFRLCDRRCLLQRVRVRRFRLRAKPTITLSAIGICRAVASLPPIPPLHNKVRHHGQDSRRGRR